MERPLRSCSADSWRDCLIAMNKQDEEVVVKTKPLTEVLECHRRKGGHASRDMIVKEGSNRCTVRRNLLWELVQAHGKLCELKERPLV